MSVRAAAPAIESVRPLRAAPSTESVTASCASLSRSASLADMTDAYVHVEGVTRTRSVSGSSSFADAIYLQLVDTSRASVLSALAFTRASS